MRALSLKYRPQTFDEVVGHEVIIKILKTQIEQGSVGHALLFAGKTGTGKTTVSRLLASAINEGLGTPIEIDAASNNGVDNVRAIIEDAKERAIDCTYKVYIIDEAQGLSNAAWQAFLKCIEEPPKYSIFIFCTTDPQKIPATIVNRTQKFVFKSLPDNLIANRLAEICELEGFTNYRESIEYISKVAQGCMREAITLVDKCADYSTSLSIENVSKVLGLSTFSTLFDLLNSLIDNNQVSILNITEDILRESSDPKLFVDQFLEFLINIQKFIIFNDVGVTYFSPTQIESLNYVTGLENPSGYYNYLINKLFELKVCLKDDNDPDSTIKVLFMQMGRGQ